MRQVAAIIGHTEKSVSNQTETCTVAKRVMAAAAVTKLKHHQARRSKNEDRPPGA